MSTSNQGSRPVKRTTVLGGGAFGTCMAHVLGRNGVSVKMWVFEEEVRDEINNKHSNERFLKGIKLPQTVTATSDFAESLQDSELVLVVIPTPFLRSVVVKQHHLLPVGVPLVCCSKGIENGSLLTPIEILQEELPGKYHDYLAVLSGPSFAIEVATMLPTSVLVASEDPKIAETVQLAMSDPAFRIYTGNDLIGAEVCGAIKNVIAISCGFANGLGLGSNTTAMLITRGLEEISRLAILKGGHPGTMSGLAGLGDLVLTCNSSKSRNYTVGMRIAKGDTIKDITESRNAVAEGVRTSKSVNILCQQYGIELPLCGAVYRGLWEGKDMRTEFSKLLAMPLEEEFNPYKLYREVQAKRKKKQSKL